MVGNFRVMTDSKFEQWLASQVKSSKLDTSDMRILQTVPTSTHPIGITYDATTSRVWVACYSGAIMVFDDA